MQERSNTQTSTFLVFLVLAFGWVMIHGMVFRRPQAPQQAEQQEKGEKNDAQKKNDDKKDGKDKKNDGKAQPDVKTPGTKEKDPAAKGPEKQPVKQPAKPVVPPDQNVPAIDGDARYVHLGSADPDSPFRMHVTLTDRGAAVYRVELNSDRYHSLTDEAGYLAYKGGYLGRVVADGQKRGKGCLVQIVGRGTPADVAGLKLGDQITELAGQEVSTPEDLQKALQTTKPGQQVEIKILRNGDPTTVTATLSRPPMEVIHPEGLDRKKGPDPFSFLMTLSRADDQELPGLDAKEDEENKEDKDGEDESPEEKKKALLTSRPPNIDKELPGLQLRKGSWKIANSSPTEARFECDIPHLGLRLAKTYRLAEVPDENRDDADYKAYHLVLDVEVLNMGESDREVAYQLDGPTGLPIEGWWYANKVGLADCWGAGMRDFVFQRHDEKVGMTGCAAIAKGDVGNPLQDKSIRFIGIDSLYFSSIMLPLKGEKKADEIWIAEAAPIRVGPVKDENYRIADTSCRLRSLTKTLAPNEAVSHSYEIFLGPKRPELLAKYDLDNLVSYGWFDIFARPLVGLLHFLQSAVLNWGLAILLLTVIVRAAMFPLSRKQAIGMQKMAKIQPELKKIQEKYKKDLEAKTRATNELFKKHGYHPASGCLPIFIQMPIFIGLYRGLMVDVELRGSSLLGSAVRWCSNLAAPDMLFDWHSWMPPYFTYGYGMLKLGPYFNLLPILAMILMIVQQKMMTPPPADEQQAMQQKMMKFMMIFMGVVFFKIAAGLCIYFVVSTFWGLAERKLLPKTQTAQAGAESASSTPAETKAKTSGRNGSPGSKRARTKGKKR
ncbi:MAG: YidC/Oxa1 family insertase periplasmic-domain containing protein [Pirellulales bacterium]|nr:YidC/Oxa1 family insertase periplasmic-domain containing protein [Pirellulales bacterium]